MSFQFGTFDIVSDFELRISGFVPAVRGALAMLNADFRFSAFTRGLEVSKDRKVAQLRAA